jgi:hypothetical protein
MARLNIPSLQQLIKNLLDTSDLVRRELVKTPQSAADQLSNVAQGDLGADKTPDGRIIMSSAIVVIREISKSTGTAPDFQNSLLFSLFSGNFGTASLRIGGEGVCVAVR